jgi:hypothetical protein
MDRTGATRPQRNSRSWLIAMALFCLAGSLGCSLARKIVRPPVQAVSAQEIASTVPLDTPTRTPRSTFTPTQLPSPAPSSTATPLPAPRPTDTLTPTDTPFRAEPATATPNPSPTETRQPTRIPTPAPPAATLPPTATLLPAFPYQVAELYKDRTSNSFLVGYVAIVSAQEIPIGGIKLVGTFDPGGYYYESPLSNWYFEGYSAPGGVTKTGSVKFEPPGGILKGTWLIHLEDEHGTRLSGNVPIATDPENTQWFFTKFKQVNPSPGAGATATRSPGPTATREPTPAGQPTSIRTPVPTATPLPATAGWSFIHIRTFVDRDDESVILYGEMVNGTGSAQEVYFLTGTFYGDQGQVIADEDSTYDYWPVEVVPSGGTMPFELTVYDVQTVSNYELRVVSQPTSATLRQDFEISGLSGIEDGTEYCVTGTLRNPGSDLEDFVLLAAIVYNGQDQVINFGEDEADPEDLESGGSYDLEICVETPGEKVASFAVQAWGE